MIKFKQIKQHHKGDTNLYLPNYFVILSKLSNISDTISTHLTDFV